MEEKEEMIIENIKKSIPRLTEPEKEKLLSFSEGYAFAIERREEAKSDRPA